MTIHDDMLNTIAEQAMEAIDKRPNGVYAIDLKENGGPNITEVNAGRFHASSYVYTSAGPNLPYYYAKLALGESLELLPKRNALKAGIMTIRSMENVPLFVDHQELERGILKL